MEFSMQGIYYLWYAFRSQQHEICVGWVIKREDDIDFTNKTGAEDVCCRSAADKLRYYSVFSVLYRNRTTIPVTVDWLPWYHESAGIIRNGTRYTWTFLDGFRATWHYVFHVKWRRVPGHTCMLLALCLVPGTWYQYRYLVDLLYQVIHTILGTRIGVQVKECPTNCLHDSTINNCCVCDIFVLLLPGGGDIN